MIRVRPSETQAPKREAESAPAKRSGGGALTVPELRAERAKAGSRFACPRTPKLPALQQDVAHPTVPSLNLEKADGTAKYANHAKAERIRGGDRFSQRVNVLVSSTPFPSAYLFRGLNCRFAVKLLNRFEKRQWRKSL